MTRSRRSLTRRCPVPGPQRQRRAGPLRGPAAVPRRARRGPPPPAVGGGEGRPALPHDHRRWASPGAHDVPGAFGPADAARPGDRAAAQPLQRAQLPSARETARWQNAMQELAEETPHGIPITFSSDPRHGFTENVGMALAAGALSQWPEPLGLAAIGDPTWCGGSPTSPGRSTWRWACARPCTRRSTSPPSRAGPGRRRRSARTRATASAFVAAWLRGHAGRASWGRTASPARPSTSRAAARSRTARTRTSRTAGSRSTRAAGSTSTWRPFRAAIAAGTSGMMPYYGMPVGLELDGEPVEEVGFGVQPPDHHRPAPRGARLRRRRPHRLGPGHRRRGRSGRPFPAKAWGVEHLSPLDRVATLARGRRGPARRRDAHRPGARAARARAARGWSGSTSRCRRILLSSSRSGSSTTPTSTRTTAERIVGAPEFRAAGHRAQAEAVTVLKNDGVLPLAAGRRLYVEGVDPAVAAEYGTVVDRPGDADVAVVRLQAPVRAPRRLLPRGDDPPGLAGLPGRGRRPDRGAGRAGAGRSSTCTSTGRRS